MSSDDLRFGEMMFKLGSTFGRAVDAMTIEAFRGALADLDMDEVIAAGEQWVRTGRKFPVPVELRELTGGSREAEAQEAWEEVLRLASNSRAAKHSDPVAEECVRQLGGWIALGQRDPEQLRVWTRKEFLALYATGAPRREVEHQLAAGSPMAELVGAVAGKKALPAPPPRRRS